MERDLGAIVLLLNPLTRSSGGLSLGSRLVACANAMHAPSVRKYLLKRHIIPMLALSSLITASAIRRGHDLPIAPSACAMLHNHIVRATRAS